jgi:hypothetical protein
LARKINLARGLVGCGELDFLGGEKPSSGISRGCGFHDFLDKAFFFLSAGGFRVRYKTARKVGGVTG